MEFFPSNLFVIRGFSEKASLIGKDIFLFAFKVLIDRSNLFFIGAVRNTIVFCIFEFSFILRHAILDWVEVCDVSCNEFFFRRMIS